MEVEVKLRLGGKDDYDRLAAALAPGAGPTYRQENFFFDGPDGELNARRVAVRVRLYNGDEKATLTVKGEQVLKDGIGRAPETEEALAPAAARRFVAEPGALLAHDSEIVRSLARCAAVCVEGDGVGRRARQQEKGFHSLLYHISNACRSR